MAKYYYHKYSKATFLHGVNVLVAPYDTQTRDTDVYKLNETDFKVIPKLINSQNMESDSLYIAGSTRNWDAGGRANIRTQREGEHALLAPSDILVHAIKDLSLGEGDFIETIKAEDGTYPDNGIHTDGFWYAKGDKATIPVVFVENGKAVEIAEAFYVENGKAISIKAYEVVNGKAIELW